MSLLTGLSCYLTLDEAANSTRNDSTANGKNFADVATNVGQSAGLIGHAAHFTNVSGQLLDNGAAILPSGPLSVSLWFNPDASQPATAMGLWCQSQSGSIKQAIRAFGAAGGFITSLVFSVSSATDVTYTVTLASSTWYHIGLTYDGASVVTAYFNGQPVGSASGKSYATAPTLTCIGNTSTLGTSCLGSVDECGMWARKLAFGEMLGLYNSGRGLAYPLALGTDYGIAAFGGVAQRMRRHGMRGRKF